MDINYNSIQNVVCILLLLFMVLVNYKSLYYNNYRSKCGYLIFGLFITLFSVYYRPIGGDFWFSYEEFQKGDSLQIEHMENIYVWLKKNLNYNYLLWRLIVWGSASIFIVTSFKKIKIDSSLAIVVFLTFALVQCFYYLRNSLAFSILYFGVVLYTTRTKRNNLLSWTIIIFIIAISWYFHKSMPLYIILSIIAMFIPLRKGYILGSIIIFPLLYYGVYGISESFLSSDIWMTDYGLRYLEAENSLYINWRGYVMLMIKYIPYIYISIVYLKSFTRSEKTQKTFFLITYMLIYLSFLFMYQGSNHLSSRLYNTAMLPFSFFIASYIKEHKKERNTKVFIYITIMVYFISYVISIIS